MKKLHFFVIMVFALLGISNSLYSLYPKLPLMERWTGASCAPCADYNEQGYSSWTANHRNELAIITWHTNASGPDPIWAADPTVTGWRSLLYDSLVDEPIVAVPEVKWNGKRDGAGTPDSTRLNQLLKAEAGKMTPMSILPTLTIEGDIATVHVKVFTEVAMDNIKLRILLVESAVNYTTPPGNNGERVFPYVVKFLVPDSSGVSLSLSSGETWEETFTQAGMTGNRVTHPDRMYVVAFVEEMTKEHNIVQAAMSCETVPYPPIYEAKAKIRYSLPYNKLAHEDLVTHVLQIENPDNYEILVTPKFHRISSGQDAWEIVSSNLPTEPFVVAPNTTNTYEYSITHNGDRPASLQTAWELDCIMSEDALEELGGVALNTVQIGGYIDMTDDIKYAFITGAAAGDGSYSYGAFRNASHFNGELINIPSTFADIPHPTLFTGDFLDNLEFLGFHTSPWTWVYDIAYNPNNPNIEYKFAMQNKLAAMKNTRMFMSSDPYTHWQITDTSKGGNAKDAEWKPERAAISQFLFDEFGIWSGKWETKPWMTALFYRLELGTVYARALFGEEGDSISMARPTLILNSSTNSLNKDYYLTAFDSLSDYATSVYNYYHYEYVVGDDGYNLEDEYGRYVIDDSVFTKNVMVKWDKDGIRRVTAGFNFGMISADGQASSDIVAMANSIVDWLFAPLQSIEDGETNMSTKNGLLLRTEPNPVTSVSHVIVQNTNDIPVATKVYLLDVSGKMIINLFDGTLEIGDNYIELSNSNIAAGTYFVVTETAAGKTYMSVAIAK